MSTWDRRSEPRERSHLASRLEVRPCPRASGLSSFPGPVVCHRRAGRTAPTRVAAGGRRVLSPLALTRSRPAHARTRLHMLAHTCTHVPAHAESPRTCPHTPAHARTHLYIQSHPAHTCTRPHVPAHAESPRTHLHTPARACTHPHAPSVRAPTLHYILCQLCVMIRVLFFHFSHFSGWAGQPSRR